MQDFRNRASLLPRFMGMYALDQVRESRSQLKPGAGPRTSRRSGAAHGPHAICTRCVRDSYASETPLGLGGAAVARAALRGRREARVCCSVWTIDRVACTAGCAVGALAVPRSLHPPPSPPPLSTSRAEQSRAERAGGRAGAGGGGSDALRGDGEHAVDGRPVRRDLRPQGLVRYSRSTLPVPLQYRSSTPPVPRQYRASG
jgi:hypothetical protein